MMMLSGLCNNGFYDVFERRCQELEKMEIFSAMYSFPTHFAQEISDALQSYHSDDKNVIHYMVKFLLSSDCPVSF